MQLGTWYLDGKWSARIDETTVGCHDWNQALQECERPFVRRPKLAVGSEVPAPGLVDGGAT